jgi:hypothetical protein
MAIEFDNGNDTIGTTEYSLPNGGTTLTPQTDSCILQTYIDFSNMAAGDEYQVRVYETINGGSPMVVYTAILSGVQSEPWVPPSLLVGEGWDVTLQRLAGADRDLAWSIRKVA